MKLTITTTDEQDKYTQAYLDVRNQRQELRPPGSPPVTLEEFYAMELNALLNERYVGPGKDLVIATAPDLRAKLAGLADADLALALADVSSAVDAALAKYQK
jgi:hypothetical protein